MTTVLEIENHLDGEIVISGQHIGDICCKKLTITRSGSVKGNILCKHLQIGGFVEGIAVCHALEGNTQGTLHGSLYYVTKKDEAKVAGIVDYREPPASVWAVVMPETVVADEFSLISETDVDAIPEALAIAADEFEKNFSGAELMAPTENEDRSTHEDGLSSTEIADAEEQIVFARSQPVEVIGTSSKFFPTPIEAVKALQNHTVQQPGGAWVSTGRKVPLNARFF
jgi:hypothetical protein